MANIKLPARFQQKLQENQELDGIVKSTLSEFGDILKDNKLYFFEEYTDHGISHIEKVLSSSDNLITDDTFNKILSPYDIGYFILTVILHDIGMHLNIEGFEALINGEFDGIRSNDLDVNTWAKLWHDFLNEAKKYSGKQLKGIFGDENTLIQIPPISEKDKINSTDKKLIGEFIRKHHPRLAHEIAIKGFPGKPSLIEFAKGLDFTIRNMIGLIARSHGVDLRKCLTNVELIYGKNIRRTPNSTHAIYLMVLLRIADYIQIDKSRTSKTLLKTKTFSSPISENEHASHLAITDVDDKYQDDPERIFVTTAPNDSKMFLKLKKLIKDIQFEFDISWAVLGELYGSIPFKPQIKYRRITSNLSEEQFKNSQNYIADSFSFKANDEIVRLLIGPFYGNEPTYGIRELLQNSIDACKERQEIEKKEKGYSYSALIKVEVMTNAEAQSYFVISDNGVGMDAQIVKDYFLSAGASYRKNIDWQKQFVDDSGKVSVRKSGRFGIGILAAFLIGKEIIVETKKPGSDIGYSFVADLFSEQINVLKDKNITEGTTIKIKIDSQMLEKLEPFSIDSRDKIEWFEWFTFKKPEIKYTYLDEEIIAYDETNPDLDEELPIEWNAMDAENYNKVLWTFSKKYVQCEATCNGIIIPTYNTYPNINIRPILRNQQVSIFDNNAITPLNLNRNSFSNSPPWQVFPEKNTPWSVFSSTDHTNYKRSYEFS